MSKPSAKLQLSSQRGSAVAEFVLLALPLCLIVAGSATYCLNALLDTTLRTQTLSAARFAALADVSLEQAQTKVEEFCTGLSARLGATCVLNQRDQAYAVVTVSYQPLAMFIYSPKRVSFSAAVASEAK